MKNSIFNSTFGFIVGDALGCPVEYEAREALRQDPVKGMMGHGTHDQPAGAGSVENKGQNGRENRMSEKKGFFREEEPPDIEEEFALGQFHTGGLSNVLNSPFGGELMRPFARDTFLRHVRIVGGHHMEGIEELWAGLKPEDIVHLIREPQNPVDEYAILVMNEEMEKLGYIPRAENRVFARLMDAGKKLHADISMIQDPEEYYDPVWIAIYLED